MNVKATDGKGLDEKAKQIRADIPKYKASQKKVRIEDILKDSDLGSENIENELLDEILGKGRRKANAPKDTNNSGSVGSNIKVSIYDGKTTPGRYAWKLKDFQLIACDVNGIKVVRT